MPQTLAMADKTACETVAIGSNSQACPLTDAVLRALDRLGFTDKELAAILRVPPSQFSRQKGNREGNYLQVQRFDATLPPDVHGRFIDFLIEELAAYRGRVVATPHGHLKHVADALVAMGAAVRSLSAMQPALGPALPLLEDRPRV
jgi:hypothetical protein